MLDTMTILYHFWQARKLMNSFQTREELEQWQYNKLAYFKRHTLIHSPFYRAYVDKPLAEFPMMHKPKMIEAFDQINTAGINLSQALTVAKQAEENRNFAAMINGITIGLSSGTSGKQNIFLAARKERLKWAGIMLAKALPASIVQPQKIAFFLRANSNLYATLKKGRHIQFEFFDLTQNFADNLKRLNEYCPSILTAPASVLKYITKAQESGAIHISPLKLFSVAEVLDPADQAYIETVFGQMVHQIYQCTEGFLGITHNNGKLYLNEEYVYIEKEWIDKPSGRFIPIITDFSRTTQPIIRYRLEDILVEDAADTSPFTCLKAIDGRADDVCYFESSHGAPKPIFADSIRQALTASHAIFAEYRMIQHSPQRLEIQLLPQGEAENESGITQALKHLCEKQGCVTPDIHFTAYQPNPPHKKLRRIERRFEFDQRVAA